MAPVAVPKRGAKWNKGKAVSDASTKWSTALIDLKKEIEKTVAAQLALNVAENKLEESARIVYKASRDFNLAQYEIFRTWNGEGWECNGKKIEFDTILSDESHRLVRTQWQETVTDVAELRSWTYLQTFASLCYAKCNDKAALDASVATGKDLRKIASAFVKATRQNASTLETKINKLQVDVDKEKELSQKKKTVLTEANLLAVTVPLAPPPAAPGATNGKLNLMDGIGDIPELTTFTIQDSKAFNHAHVLRLHSESSINDKVVPYALSANAWLAKVQSEDAVTQCFGAFMASFLGSVEYKSPLGRATQSLNGITSVGSALRSVVVIPGSKCIPVPLAQLKQVVKSPKQQGQQCKLICM